MTNEKNLNYTGKEFTQPNVPKTYEQFVLEEQQVPSQEQNVADSYETEFNASNSVGANKGHGPCPEQYYSDSSGNYVRITVTNNREAKKKLGMREKHQAHKITRYILMLKILVILLM